MIEVDPRTEAQGLATALITLRLSGDAKDSQIQEALLRSVADKQEAGEVVEVLMYALIHACDWAAGLTLSHADFIHADPDVLFSQAAIQVESRKR